MKVLILLYVRDMADIVPECIRAIEGQDCQDFTLMIHAMKPIPMNPEPHRNRTENIVRNRNYARKMALGSEAEWILWLDGDTIMPPNAISDFLKCAKETKHTFLAGWYKKHGSNDWVAGRWVKPNVMRYFQSPVPGVIEADLIGIGCAFMHRSVLEKLEFRGAIDEMISDEFGTTYYKGNCISFCEDATKLGIRSYLVGSIVCRHIYVPHMQAGFKPRTIVTASDAFYFPGLMLLLENIPFEHVLVFDYGLSSEQKEKIASKKNVSLRDVPEKGTMPNTVDMYKAWNKPFLLESIQDFDDVLWIDSDCIVLGSLEPLFRRIMHKMFAIQNPDEDILSKKNSEELYKLFPVPNRKKGYANNGVIGLRLSRDSDFLKTWKGITVQAFDEKIRSLIAWWDEGAFNWSIQKLERYDCILNDRNWNFLLPMKYQREFKNISDMSSALKSKVHTIVIAHMSGSPKFWTYAQGTTAIK